jgi:hypothetical protein
MGLKIGMLSNQLSKIHRFPSFSDARSLLEQLTVMLPILGALGLRSPQQTSIGGAVHIQSIRAQYESRSNLMKLSG